MNNWRNYFVLLFAAMSVFGLAGSASAGSGVAPSGHAMLLQSTNIFQEIINFFERLFGISASPHSVLPSTTIPYLTTTIPSTTTVGYANACIPAPGLVCSQTSISSTGLLSLDFGHYNSSQMFNPSLACSATSQAPLPLNYTSINGGNPLLSGQIVSATGIQCPVNASGVFHGYLWLNYQVSPSSGYSKVMLAAAISIWVNYTGGSGSYYYTGTYSGSSVTLNRVPGHSVENDSGATLVGQISNFYTNNSYYSCLNGRSLNVWSDPNVYGTHYLIVHNGLQGSQCTYITLLLPPSCFKADQTVYVGYNQTCGSFTAELVDLGQPNSNGVSPTYFNIYFNGVLTNVSSAIYPNNQTEFNFSGHLLFLYVNKTFAGLYQYQRWARINLLGVNST